MSDRGTIRVGVREVARRAGVSTQTVSRVINESPNIRPETRDRVLTAMADLGYRVNNAARALGTRRTRVLGIIATDASLFGPTSGIAAIETAARAAGRWIASVYADAGDDDSIVAALEHLLSQGVDGLLLVAPHERTLDLVSHQASGIPFVALHTGAGAAGQIRGTEAIVEHLADLGHRRIARVRGPQDWLEESARAVGYAQAVQRLGVDAGPTWRGDWSAASGYAVAGEVADAVRTPGGPTAVVVANDQMALGLIAGLRVHGIEVPGAVSVAGFDDNPDAAFYRPALTTVRIDLAGEARRAVAEVLGASAPPASDPALVIRDSTAPPA